VVTKGLPAYCAVALAGLNDLPDTISTRSVIIRMRRRAPGEHVEPWRHRIHATEGHQLAERLAKWSVAEADRLTWPDIPEGIVDRNADVWESLLMVADLAGGDWSQAARVAAVALVADLGKDRGKSLGIQLLTDLQSIFGDEDGMHTEVILGKLNSNRRRAVGEPARQRTRRSRTRKPSTPLRRSTLRRAHRRRCEEGIQSRRPRRRMVSICPHVLLEIRY
jgi:hypothetical protein